MSWRQRAARSAQALGVTVRALPVLAIWFVASTARADLANDLDSAQQRWRSLGASDYSFMYEWNGAVVVAPRCADARILVQVKGGNSVSQRVVKGSSRCPIGTSGAKAIGLSVPGTVEELFAEMSRYIRSPPVAAKVTARFDEKTGMPLEYFVEKLEFQDNDEGFRTSKLAVKKVTPNKSLERSRER